MSIKGLRRFCFAFAVLANLGDLAASYLLSFIYVDFWRFEANAFFRMFPTSPFWFVPAVILGVLVTSIFYILSGTNIGFLFAFIFMSVYAVLPIPHNIIFWLFHEQTIGSAEFDSLSVIVRISVAIIITLAVFVIKRKELMERYWPGGNL